MQTATRSDHIALVASDVERAGSAGPACSSLNGYEHCRVAAMTRVKHGDTAGAPSIEIAGSCAQGPISNLLADAGHRCRGRPAQAVVTVALLSQPGRGARRASELGRRSIRSLRFVGWPGPATGPVEPRGSMPGNGAQNHSRRSRITGGLRRFSGHSARVMCAGWTRQVSCALAAPPRRAIRGRLALPVHRRVATIC